MDFRRVASKVATSSRLVDITKELTSKLAGSFKDRDDADDFINKYVDLWISPDAELYEFDAFEVGLMWSGDKAFYCEIDHDTFIFNEASKNEMYKALEQQQLKRRFGP